MTIILTTKNKSETAKDYYTLQDEQGAGFCDGVIFEGIKEVKQQFNFYADTDGYESDVAGTWTISDCIQNWQFTLRKWNGATFEELSITAPEWVYIKE